MGFFYYADGLALSRFRTDYEFKGLRYFRVSEETGRNFFDYVYSDKLGEMEIPFRINYEEYVIENVVHSHTCFSQNRELLDYVVHGKCKTFLELRGVENEKKN